MAGYAYKILGQVSTSGYKISSRWANSQVAGLCPPIVPEITSPLSVPEFDTILSEYGVRKYIDYKESQATVSGINVGEYEYYLTTSLSGLALSGLLPLTGGVYNNRNVGFFNRWDEDTNTALFNTFTVAPEASARITIDLVTGPTINNVPSKNIRFNYDGRESGVRYYSWSANGVNNGKYVMTSYIPAGLDSYEHVIPDPWVSGNPPPNFDYDTVFYTANGVCTEEYALPINNNAYCGSLSAADFMVGKIGIKIPLNSPFAIDGQKMYVGARYDVSTNNLQDVYGYFYTADAATILSGRTAACSGTPPQESPGEYRPFYYLNDLAKKNYWYYTSCSTICLSATNLKIARRPGNYQNTNIIDMRTTNGEFINKFFGDVELSVWFDRISYVED